MWPSVMDMLVRGEVATGPGLVPEETSGSGLTVAALGVGGLLFGVRVSPEMERNRCGS